ncbi:MAG TPA: phage tail sheath subtilisin-like domain-containing protein, partial [Longimicrobiaceae bacterium]|nr:phage tail sheath subtilisin-like domain-containing protein [Longimicrobiaceae bacterium]
TARGDQDGITDEVARGYGVPRETLLNLTVTLNLGGGVVQTETYPLVSVSPAAGSDRLDRVLQTRSAYVRWTLPETPAQIALGAGQLLAATAAGGDDGAALADADLAPADGQRTGIYALDGCDLFNLLCIPPDSPALGQDALNRVWNAAAHYCVARRAFLLVDPPAAWAAAVSGGDVDAVRIDDLGSYADEGRNAAVYFPALVESDPLAGGGTAVFAPSGAVAGVIARTDAGRGVWKSPAGVTDGALSGVRGLQVTLTDEQNGMLNPQGINCLRTFPVYGSVVWGSRTLKGADLLEDDYKYLSVCRLALYIEESVYRGTAWTVFQPSGEPLWSSLRLSVGGFMAALYGQGAFAGGSAPEAYFVTCDATTTTPADIESGVVNVVVGFAPLRPAEFLVLAFALQAGQSPDGA